MDLCFCVVSLGNPVDLSVVIPLYNGEKTIASTLRSVCRQTLWPKEIIVVNDGSTDRSVEKIDAFVEALRSSPQGGDPQLDPVGLIRVLNQQNRGEGEARNTGIREANSPWVAFLDADDLWYPDHLAEIDQIIRLFPQSHLVGTSHIQAHLKTVEDSLPQRLEGPISVRSINYFVESTREIGIIWSSAAAARRESLLEIGGFGRWKAGADLEMWARLALRHPVAHSSKVTAIYAQHSNSVMAQLSLTNSPNQIVDRLDDLSPSSKTVYQALLNGEHNVEGSSLKTYLNGRLASSLRQNLVNGDISEAKHLVALALRPSNGLIKFVRFTPTPLLRLLSLSWRIVVGPIRRQLLRR